MDVIEKRFGILLLISMAMVLIDAMVGVSLFVFVDLSSKISSVILGSLILIHGLFYLIRYVYDGLGNRFFAVNLVCGVAAIILGIFMYVNPFDKLSTMGIMFGIWMFITAAEKLFYGIKFIKGHDEIAPLVTFISVLLFVMGILSIVNPFSAFMLISRLIGIFVVCYALFEIMVSRLFLSRGKEVLKLFD